MGWPLNRAATGEIGQPQGAAPTIQAAFQDRIGISSLQAIGG
jgi:hypothetical protein